MIPVIRQPCFDNSLIPIGIVTAEVRCESHHLDDIDELVGKLANKAPEGCVGLYNFHFEERGTPDRRMLRGYADAFRKPAGRPCR